MALVLIPLAQISALSFTAPLFTTVTAVVVLGEVIRIRRITALAVGFAGTWIILRPGVVEVELGSILALLSALGWGASMVLVKILSRSDSAIGITFYGALFIAPISLIAAIPYWQTPTLAELAWMAAIAVFATLVHLCFNQAIKEADLTVLLPFDFTRLIWAAIVGYLVFAEAPSVWTWVGGAMIFVAGTYLAIREGRPTDTPGAVPTPGARVSGSVSVKDLGRPHGARIAALRGPGAARGGGEQGQAAVTSKKLGLIVNPIAGMGGKVGLKGTDGRDILEKARALGAEPVSPARAVKALGRIAAAAPDVEIVTYAGEMGADECRECGLGPLVVGEAGAGETEAADTRNAAKDMLRANVDLVLFAGGDGTARDVYGVVGDGIPVLGIPTGVKIHSAVFATSPENAGNLAAEYLGDDSAHVRVRAAEVMDIDEQAFRENRLSARLYGYARAPYLHAMIQSAKAGAAASEDAALEALGHQFTNAMEDDVLYIIGPGTTTRHITAALGVGGTLLGVDAVRDRKLIGADLNEIAAPRAGRRRAGQDRGHGHRRPGLRIRARQPADQRPGHPRGGQGEHRHRHDHQQDLRAPGKAVAGGHRRRRNRPPASGLRSGADGSRREHHAAGRVIGACAGAHRSRSRSLGFANGDPAGA